LEINDPDIKAACFGRPLLPPGMLASNGPAKVCIVDRINQFLTELKNPKTDLSRVFSCVANSTRVQSIHCPACDEPQRNVLAPAHSSSPDSSCADDSSSDIRGAGVHRFKASLSAMVSSDNSTTACRNLIFSAFRNERRPIT